MKKIYLLPLFIFFMCCEVKIEPREAKAYEIFSAGSCHVNYNRYVIGDIEYGVFYVGNETSQSGNGVSVINLTKDKLEIEKLKLEIAAFK